MVIVNGLEGREDYPKEIKAFDLRCIVAYNLDEQIIKIKDANAKC